ncbi:hypothetical protein ACXXDK_07820 [Deinococcus sp. PESE-38]|nr:roadblock/LC7 domain-containing protein [Deinococcus radiodurans]
MIEPSLALYGEAFARVDQHLEELLGATGVRYCLLVDRKGFVLSHKEALWAPRPPRWTRSPRWSPATPPPPRRWRTC